MGYLIQFYHLLLVSQEPVEFPSYGLGSAKAQALQAEVDGMLGKEALEVVDLPSLAYHCCLFQVYNVTRGWRPVALLAINH